MPTHSRRYEDYLNSEAWSRLRARRIGIDNGQCRVCGAQATQVHHKKYPAVLGRERVDDLISLCNACHGHKHGKAAQVARTVGLRNVRHISEIIDSMEVEKCE